MITRLCLIVAALLALGCACAQDEEPQQDWSQTGKPAAIRGRITLLRSEPIREYYLETPTGEYYWIVKSAYPMRSFFNLNVELKGWIGLYNGIPIIQPAQVPQVLVPAWWSLPFLLLLACIAIVPFISKHFWEHHFHHISVALGAVVVLVYLTQLGLYGRNRLFEVTVEYFQFIALIGSLFVVTGGILIDVSGHGKPLVNTALLACGALVANLFGTTGASALLIRPYLRINKDRLRPFHVVLFIFIVANCGGALTPIGDPPLFLGYLYGVPFSWTLVHLWPAWAFAVGLLLVAFFLMDALAAPKGTSQEKTRVRISGLVNFICLGAVLFGVFLDQFLFEHVTTRLEHYPLGALLMIFSAAVAYFMSKPENLQRNEFTFGPIREVAWLFVGIFATMVPALDYLAANASQLGITTPGGFYFASGALSSVLDNAPTYLNFLSAAHGLQDMPLSREQMPQFISRYPDFLIAISLGSVFFGACTYIGNGPNFMVKAIADASGAQTPGFFGYVVKYALPLLIPIYVLVWLLFVRA